MGHSGTAERPASAPDNRARAVVLGGPADKLGPVGEDADSGDLLLAAGAPWVLTARPRAGPAIGTPLCPRPRGCYCAARTAPVAGLVVSDCFYCRGGLLMSSVEVRPLHRSDRQQLADLANVRAQAVVPGMGVQARCSASWSARWRTWTGVNEGKGVGSSFETCEVSKEGPTPVFARVSPTDRARAQIDALFASDRGLSEILE
jgi:hypothetical protein